MKVVESRMRWAGHMQTIRQEDRLSKREWKAEEGGRKTVSHEILKGQVRTAKSGRPSKKTEGDGES